MYQYYISTSTLSTQVSTAFKYSRFDHGIDDKCAVRDVAKLDGARVGYASGDKNKQVCGLRRSYKRDVCRYIQLTRPRLNAVVRE